MKSEYKDYLKLNKNLLVAFAVALCISTIIANELSEEESHINSTITIVADFMTYFSIFILLFLFDNRKKYRKMDGTKALKRDIIKILSSLGVAEIAYLVNRWFWQFYLLNIEFEAYQASLISQIISFVIFLIVTNVMMKVTKFHK